MLKDKLKINIFSGIIKYQGQIKEIRQSDSIYLTIFEPELVKNLEIGSSVSHDGACLTVLELFGDGCYSVQLMPETWKKTAFSQRKVGDTINLEPSLKLQDVVDGHLVMGHVDGTGKVTNYIQENDNWVLRISLLENLKKLIAKKGSVAINGTSLTVSDDMGDEFEVSLIKHTIKNTNLGKLKVGDLVNLEMDILARYVQKMLI